MNHIHARCASGVASPVGIRVWDMNSRWEWRHLDEAAHWITSMLTGLPRCSLDYLDDAAHWITSMLTGLPRWRCSLDYLDAHWITSMLTGLPRCSLDYLDDAAHWITSMLTGLPRCSLDYLDDAAHWITSMTLLTGLPRWRLVALAAGATNRKSPSRSKKMSLTLTGSSVPPKYSSSMIFWALGGNSWEIAEHSEVRTLFGGRKKRQTSSALNQKMYVFDPEVWMADIFSCHRLTGFPSHGFTGFSSHGFTGFPSHGFTGFPSHGFIGFPSHGFTAPPPI